MPIDETIYESGKWNQTRKNKFTQKRVINSTAVLIQIKTE